MVRGKARVLQHAELLHTLRMRGNTQIDDATSAAVALAALRVGDDATSEVSVEHIPARLSAEIDQRVLVSGDGGIGISPQRTVRVEVAQKEEGQFGQRSGAE